MANNTLVTERYRHFRRQSVSAPDARKLVAEELGLTPDVVKGIVEKKAFTPEAATHRPGVAARQNYATYATSTLYRVTGQNEEGEEQREVVLQWVKEARNNERAIAQEMIAAMAEELPKVSVKPLGKHSYRDDVLAVYPMGDPHFGMFSWAEETGEDFDLKIAERNLCDAVARLVDTVPPCERALIINLGDFFHADNVSGTTTKGTQLDTDSRWAKVLRVGVKAIRQCIESALGKHKHVTVINAIGNHDTHTAMFLSVALANIYEAEDRVEIIANPTIKHYYRFGKNLLGVHHGHTIKPNQLPMQMAVDRPNDWAEASYRRWFCGHVHHQRVFEYDGVIVESFRTLAPKDAWHASQGYQAGRDMHSILLHKEYGEIERHLVNLEMLR